MYTKEDQNSRNRERRPSTADERMVFEKRVSAAKASVREARGEFCEETGSPSFDHSHSFPTKHFKWLADNELNITLLRRDKHDAFERARWWELPETIGDIVKRMTLLINLEGDHERQDLMYSFLMNKLFKCRELCLDNNEQEPIVVSEILDSV